MRTTTLGEVKIVNPTKDSEWDQQVESHPDATVFHTGAWARVLTGTYNHQPCYLRASRDGKVQAMVPLTELRSRVRGCRGICVAAADYCKPLIFDESDGQALFSVIKDFARPRGWKYVESRGPGMFAAATPSIEYYAHRLDLRRGQELLYGGFSDSVRRAIKKARRSELISEVATSAEAMADFYRLHVSTRKRHGLPPQPLRLFECIYRELIQPGFGFVSLAKVGPKVVAGAIFLRSRNKGIYKFGASVPAFLGLRPNDLVMWEAIKVLGDLGVEWLHFGRTSIGNDGLRRFKLGWGSRETKLEYFKYHLKKDTWIKNRDHSVGVYNSVFRIMPASLNRLAGTLLYPHLD